MLCAKRRKFSTKNCLNISGPGKNVGFQNHFFKISFEFLIIPRRIKIWLLMAAPSKPDFFPEQGILFHSFFAA